MVGTFADVKTFLYLCTGFQKHPGAFSQRNGRSGFRLRGNRHTMNLRNNKIEALLECIGDETKTRRQIQEDMNLRNRRNFRLHYLNPAMAKDWVRFLYVESPNKPEQAYFVTKGGMEHLREFKEQQNKNNEEV